jgi:hypothetical protein
MSLKKAAEQTRAAGRGKDTELVHFTKNEVGAMQGLAKAAGGKLTRNPKTGMLEAGFLDSMLPTLLGIGANILLPGSGMVVGGLTGALQNKENPLLGAALGAAGGYGGGQLAAGLQGAGAGAAQAAAQEAAKTAATEALTTEGLTSLTGQGVSNLAEASSHLATDATKQFLDQPFYSQLGQGAQAAFNNPMQFMEGMGGKMATAKAAGLAAAPGLYQQMYPQGGGEEENPYGDGPASEYSYDAGYTGGTSTGADPSSERQWFDPTYTRLAEGGGIFRSRQATAQPQAQAQPQPQQAVGASGAPAFNFDQATGGFTRRMETSAPQKAGGLKTDFLRGGAAGALAKRGAGAPKYSFDQSSGRFTRMAAGGEVRLAEGGFVIPADVVSMAGNGSSSAGLEAFSHMLGAIPIDGPGDGLSDDIPASINGHAPARVARQEAYIPPETVARAGGAKKLYDMLDRVRHMAHGKAEQQRPVDLRKALA